MMQKTIYVTRDSKRYGYHYGYHFWSKKPKYNGHIKGYSPIMQREIHLSFACEEYVHKVLGILLIKRGMKKLTIKIENVE